MSSRTSGGRFASSSAKDYVRNEFDRSIIEQFQAENCPNQRLAYLGLPGEAILDVLSWREYIGRWTAVQIATTAETAAIADRLIHSVLINQMERGFRLVRADIDELLADQTRRLQLEWPFQIVNLDYYGGLVGPSQRLDALRGLFLSQVGTAFVLFLTLNLRDNDQGELTKLVNMAEEELSALDLTGVHASFEAHRNLGHAGELKIYVPTFLGATATRHTLIFYPPILYQGTRPMIHFAVQCIPYKGLEAGRVFGTLERVKFINMPLLLLHDGHDLKKSQLGSIN